VSAENNAQMLDDLIWLGLPATSAVGAKSATPSPHCSGRIIRRVNSAHCEILSIMAARPAPPSAGVLIDDSRRGDLLFVGLLEAAAR
jgi:hypothetical protein